MKSLLRTIAWLTALALTVQLIGCDGGGDVRRAEVSGEVTLDGEPVPKGSIVFFPTAGNHGASAGGSIQDGRYKIARDDKRRWGPIASRSAPPARRVGKFARPIHFPAVG